MLVQSCPNESADGTRPPPTAGVGLLWLNGGIYGEERRAFPLFSFLLLVGFYWDWHGWLLYNNGMASSKRTDGRKTVCGLVAGNTRSRRFSSACTDGTDDSTAADRGLQPLPSYSYPARRRAESCPTHHHTDSFRVLFLFFSGRQFVSRVRALSSSSMQDERRALRAWLRAQHIHRLCCAGMWRGSIMRGRWDGLRRWSTTRDIPPSRGRLECTSGPASRQE